MKEKNILLKGFLENIQSDLLKNDFHPDDAKELNHNHSPLYKGQCIYVLNYVNQSVPFERGVEEMLGYTPNEFIFDFILNNYHPDDIHIVQRVLSAALQYNIDNAINKKDTLFKLCYRIRKKNGDYVKVLRTSTAYEINENGNMVSNVSTLTDISFLNIGNRVEWDFDSVGLDKKKFRKYITKSFAEYFSERHLEIIRLIAKGHSSSVIGKILSISKHTVDTHRRVLLQKTNSQNTIELLNFCTHNGIV